MENMVDVMNNKKEILQAVNVRQVFKLKDGNDFQALNNINITIYQNELVILKGRSGSGKTTLLNILGALDRPYEGNVFFNDIDLTKIDEKQRAVFRRNKIGFVFQSIALIPKMTAYENIEYALRLAKYKGDKKKRVNDCLKMVGLYGRKDHMPEEMSGGEQQRIGIARAIAHEPLIIFADEPTGALDTTTGLQVIKTLKEMINNEGVSIVMTTHDPGIMVFGDRGYELEDGEIIGKWESDNKV